jgi:hypothetical protein
VEFTTSMLGTSLRVVLQVLTMHQRPMLEMYTQLVNRRVEMREGLSGQEMYLLFYLVNIGSVRAENVRFKLGKDFEYRGGHTRIGDHSHFHGSHIAAMPPGQTKLLFVFDLPHDLENFGADGKRSRSKTEGFSFSVNYDGWGGAFGWVGWLWSRLLRRDYQHTGQFQFDPLNYSGDLPPME